jgi:hypothetical protein
LELGGIVELPGGLIDTVSKLPRVVIATEHN